MQLCILLLIWDLLKYIWTWGSKDRWRRAGFTADCYCSIRESKARVSNLQIKSFPLKTHFPVFVIAWGLKRHLFLSEPEWQWSHGTDLQMWMQMGFEWVFLQLSEMPPACEVLVLSIRFCLPFALSVKSIMTLVRCSQVGPWAAPGTSNLGSAYRSYPSEKHYLSVHLQFHSAGYVGSHIFICGLKLQPCLQCPALPASSGAAGSTSKSSLSALMLLDVTVNMAVSHFSELSVHFCNYFSALFILSSCHIRMMSRFGSKSFKSSGSAIRDEFTPMVHFLPSTKQIGLAFSHVLSISCGEETRSSPVSGAGGIRGEWRYTLRL